MCPGQLLRTTSLGKLAWWGEAGPGHKGLVFSIGAGVPEKDLVLAQQLRRQAARRAAATEEMLQAAAEGVKTRRREAAAREAAAAKAQEVAKAQLVAERAAAERAAADRAAAERAAAESEQTQLELKAAIGEIRDSVRLPGPRRKKVLRELQVCGQRDYAYNVLTAWHIMHILPGTIALYRCVVFSTA